MLRPKTFSTPLLDVRVKKNDDCRYIRVSKKNWPRAVDRNYFKRVQRDFLRHFKTLKQGIVVTAKKMPRPLHKPTFFHHSETLWLKVYAAWQRHS